MPYTLLFVRRFLPFPVFLFLLLPSRLDAQEILLQTGLSIDVNNHARFLQVPLSLQLATSSSPHGSVILGVVAGLPIANNTRVPAFSADPDSPPRTEVTRRIRSSYTTGYFGGRININPPEASMVFVDIIPISVSWERFRVSHPDQDATRYDVLNPDVGERSVLYQVGVGKGWKKGVWTVQAHIFAALAFGSRDYDVSFNHGAPLQITAGYVLSSRKKKKTT